MGERLSDVENRLSERLSDVESRLGERISHTEGLLEGYFLQASSTLGTPLRRVPEDVGPKLENVSPKTHFPFGDCQHFTDTAQRC